MTTNDAGSCEWLVGEIVHSHLIGRGELEPVVAAFQADTPYADATALAEHLVRRGLLTTFQATRLLDEQGRGLVLGPYVLVDTLGSGSLGTVYKALGKADRRAYAVKVLPVRSPWNVRQARRRLQAFPTEPHPAVVPFLDVGTSAGLYYLVWPFAEGADLEQVVRRDGLLPPARAALIALQVAQALQWCERHRTYHGSIKPSNVMLGPDGQTRLLDFGVGALLAAGDEESLVDTLSEANATSGMFDYTAPECYIDPARRSVRGDQYSLGCTLYQGLTGRVPFPDGTVFDKMVAHQKQGPVPVVALNPGVPAALAAVIERLMQKAPEARYNSTDELITALTPLARLSFVYVPKSPTPAPLLPGRAPAAAPRPGPSLLAAVQPRVPPPPSSGALSAPPRTPVPRLSTSGQSGIMPPGSAPPASNSGPSTPPPASSPSYPPIPLQSPPGPLLPPAPAPGRPFWQRFLRALAFWRTAADPVACTLLTPGGLLPGETVSIQVVVHHTDRSEQARSLPDWRGTQVIPGPIDRGEAVGLHLALPEAEVLRPLGQVEWTGLSAAALFSARVPPDWPPGRPLRGTLTIGLRQQPVARLGFTLPVATPQTTQ
jgi:serine/threonine-protein kinase